MTPCNYYYLLPPANGVWGKVIFLYLFVILFTGGQGSTWEGTPQAGTPPSPGRYTPQDRYTPACRYTPQQVHPQQVHPLGQVHPLAGTPPGRYAPGRYTPPAGPPPGRYTRLQVHPLASTPPGRYTPHCQQVHPHCQQVHPPAGTPPGRYNPRRNACWDTVNRRAVSILLECILALQYFSTPSTPKDSPRVSREEFQSPTSYISQGQ